MSDLAISGPLFFLELHFAYEALPLKNQEFLSKKFKTFADIRKALQLLDEQTKEHKVTCNCCWLNKCIIPESDEATNSMSLSQRSRESPASEREMDAYKILASDINIPCVLKQQNSNHFVYIQCSRADACRIYLQDHLHGS